MKFSFVIIVLLLLPFHSFSFKSNTEISKSDETYGVFQVGYRHTFQARNAVQKSVRETMGDIPSYSSNLGETMFGIGGFSPKSGALLWYGFNRQSKIKDDIYTRLHSNSVGFNAYITTSSNPHHNISTNFIISADYRHLSFLYGTINTQTNTWEEELFWPTQRNDKVALQQINLSPGFGIYYGKTMVIGLESLMQLGALSFTNNKNYNYKPNRIHAVFQISFTYKPDI